MALTIGTQLGSYEITALLGKGGMGEVYRARDNKLKREVAAARLYAPDLTADDETRVLYDIDHLRKGAPIRLHSVFISYSQSDSAFAEKLYSTLQARGVRCWLDKKDMLAGRKIRDEVGRAIRLQDRVLLCCSKASLNSGWVEDEIDMAFEKERSQGELCLIPLDLDGYLLTDWQNGQAPKVRARLAVTFNGWACDQALFGEQVSRVVRALYPLKRGE